MSVRRFAAYFLAVTAGSTVAFASFLIAPDASARRTASQDAGANTAAIPEMERMFQEIEARQRRKTAAKRPQIALAEYRLNN